MSDDFSNSSRKTSNFPVPLSGKKGGGDDRPPTPFKTHRYRLKIVFFIHHHHQSCCRRESVKEQLNTEEE
ncbi:hypothetical protein GWI33_012689 [Rhynchophorus ferrugineus]|uniref:Uncharacterized protein n=1 Tax=Rhynchophorus ferrugineus TaxID=354439 RepID=A0A834I613_RHYFE|nr:hypothetical protein GWI33_012689 [Rhynchophorus ferrugineus]